MGSSRFVSLKKAAFKGEKTDSTKKVVKKVAKNKQFL